jgi:PRTRC genetic system protein B
MSGHSAQFEATQGGLILTNAILLYGPEGQQGQVVNRDGAPAFASIHDIEHGEGSPTIAAGEPLSRGHLRHWTEALGKIAAPEILPENVLVSHPDLVAWWTPEQVRPSYFNLSRPPAKLKRLTGKTRMSLPYPAHLFVATRSGLGVYALPESRRPVADTPVLCSPVLNVFANGQLCWGNVRRPKTLAAASIPEFERAVFDSWSTHPNPGQELSVTGKGGLVRLWDDLAASGVQRFPVARLRAFGGGQPMTLGKLIVGSARA